MKKNIFTLAIFLLSAVSFAQFTYGPKIGGNMSRYANDKFRPGIQAGGFLNAEIFDRMGLQVDFLWAVKGNKNEITGVDSVVTTTNSYYRFIEVPICAYFPISKHLRGFAGYQVTVFRKGKDIVERKGKEVENNLSGTGKNTWIFGFDFKFDSPITLGLRFVTNQFSTGTVAGDSEHKLNSFMFNLGYTMDW